jgi:hypothetical protein
VKKRRPDAANVLQQKPVIERRIVMNAGRGPILAIVFVARAAAD